MPLASYQTIIQLIAATTTSTGLKVQCEIDTNAYPAGIKVTDAEMNAINIDRHDFHGDWNYTLKPNVRFAVVVYEQALRACFTPGIQLARDWGIREELIVAASRKHFWPAFDTCIRL